MNAVEGAHGYNTIQVFDIGARLKRDFADLSVGTTGYGTAGTTTYSACLHTSSSSGNSSSGVDSLGGTVATTTMATVTSTNNLPAVPSLTFSRIAAEALRFRQLQEIPNFSLRWKVAGGKVQSVPLMCYFVDILFSTSFSSYRIWVRVPVLLIY